LDETRQRPIIEIIVANHNLGDMKHSFYPATASSRKDREPPKPLSHPLFDSKQEILIV
jgi:hypothetical protein